MWKVSYFYYKVHKFSALFILGSIWSIYVMKGLFGCYTLSLSCEFLATSSCGYMVTHLIQVEWVPATIPLKDMQFVFISWWHNNTYRVTGQEDTKS